MNRSISLHARATAIVAVALLAGSCGSSEPLAVQLGANKLTVVVLVLDSFEPHEITATTPTLLALRDGGTIAGSAGPIAVGGGTSYAQSRSVYAAETIPNHVAMMTGVYPTRNGIPSNETIADFSAAAPPDADLSVPEKLTANTAFTWIHQRCVANGVNPGIRTAATLSKKYLYEIFRGDAYDPARANDDPDVFNVMPDAHWDPTQDPAYISVESEHTPDAPTMAAALLAMPNADFHFINLGDVDRLAHVSGEQSRQAAIEDADEQVRRLIDQLNTAGRWASTVLFIVSDHGMDYSAAGPATAISTQGMLTALDACYERMEAVDNGGTEGIFVLNRSAPLADRQAALRAARSCLLGAGCDCGATRPTNAGGIEYAWYPLDDPLDPAGAMPLALDSRHLNGGDLTLSAAAGYKFAESTTGQIPGNHGHIPTMHNTFLVTGGSPWVKRQAIAASIASPTMFDRLSEQSENVDVAPTVAWLLGLNVAAVQFPDYPERDGGFDGRVLKEAFVQFDSNANAPSPTVCGRFD